MLRIEERKCPPLHKLTLLLFDSIKEYESIVSNSHQGFLSPIVASKALRDWGAYAFKQQSPCERADAHACRPCIDGSMLYCNHCTSTRPGKVLAREKEWTALQMLEHLYEAAALMVNSHQSNLELGMMYLDMMGVLKEARRVGGTLGQLAEHWVTERRTMTRAEHLKQVRQCLVCALFKI